MRRKKRRNFEKRRARENSRRKDKNLAKGGSKLPKNRDWRDFL